MPKRDEIFTALESLVGSAGKVRLLNVYKGLPINSDAPVLEATDGMVMLKVNKYQATCLEIQRKAYIQSDDLHQVARGEVLNVNFLTESAIVTGFVYMGDDLGKRLMIRVQPREPVEIEMALKGVNLRGQMADLSASGVGIVTGAVVVRPTLYAIGTNMVVSFQLPSERAPLRIAGKIANAFKGSNSYRLGIELTPDSATKMTLNRYIAQRQSEVQRELRMMYETFYRLAAGEDATP
jgi:hypothetical protein